MVATMVAVTQRSVEATGQERFTSMPAHIYNLAKGSASVHARPLLNLYLHAKRRKKRAIFTS